MPNKERLYLNVFINPYIVNCELMRNDGVENRELMTFVTILK